MSKVQWLGETVAECKSDPLKVNACSLWANGVTVTVGQPFLTLLYRDFCLHTLCSTGNMPKAGDVPPNLPAPPPLYEMYPWGVYATETEALQKELNKKLTSDGLCTITPDGRVGASTCGAAKKYGVPLPSCSGKPSTTPAPCGSTTPKTEPTPPAAAITAPAEKPFPWLLVGGAALLAVGGMYLYSKSAAGGMAAARDNPARGPSRMATPDAQGRHPRYKHLVMFEIEPHYGSYILTAEKHPGNALISSHDAQLMFGKDYEEGFGYLTDEYLQLLEEK